jgi:uncharacterized protein
MGMDIGIAQGKIISLVPEMANRHGLITGATGTGKTITLKVLAEAFSDIGVPVFMQDVKGDLTGFIESGSRSSKFEERLQLIGVETAEFKTYPTTFWDVFGQEGHPIRTTVTDMGPLMLTRLLDLTDAQSAILYTIFKYADETGLLLLDFKDLMEVINHISASSKELPDEYRTMNKSSIGAIKRKLMMLQEEGVEHFFGEPVLDIKDLMVVDNLGRGMIHVLEASKLSTNPNLYATFLMWLLSELFEELDEVGDMDKPRLVFFFDEAHLIFKDMSKVLLNKFEQVVKLIRSKGVGIYFITQSPLDIPESVLGQLGNRVQHALRAYTPKDKKAVMVAADTFRANEAFDTFDVITSLGVGEALISFLDEEGIPSIVERAYILPPKSKIGPVTDQEMLKRYIGSSYIGRKYHQSVDRHSAYEMLTQKTESRLEAQADFSQKEVAVKKTTTKITSDKKAISDKKVTPRKTDTPVDRFVKSAASAIGNQLGRQLIRGILGSLGGKK